MAEVDLVAPVFKAPGAIVVVTDQFIAQFATSVSEEAIDALHQEHGVEVIEQVRWSENTYILRVREGDCLETSNRYHESPLVEYSHPDFVQVMDRRPAADSSFHERRVFLDGEPMPSDFRIEKGMDGYLVSEPASLLLHGGEVRFDSSGPKAPVSRVTIKSESFEGAFPNTWTLYGSPTWDDVNYRSYAGSWSGYCVDTSIAPPGPYPPNANAWMAYGPFSLGNADDARVDLQAWIRIEPGFDFFGIYASTNNVEYYGYRWAGDWASTSLNDGWVNFSFDLKRVPTLGDLRGESSVWVALVFTSDESLQYEGVYVDELVIEKVTGGYQNLTNDQFDHLQWSLNNNEQLWGVEGADISAVDAWGITHGSDAITLAVIDNGVDLTHTDLASRLVPGYDATGAGTNGGPSGDDAHGTACAGIAAGVTDNGKGIAGITRQAKLMPVNIFAGGGTQASWAADGINWAVSHGADILSNSWYLIGPVTSVTNAINAARWGGRGGKGSLVVFAAGNFEEAPVVYPASLDSTVAVGASSPCDERKSYWSCDGEWGWGSNFGADLDILAPGVFMYTTDIAGSSGYDTTSYYYNFNGTSSAAPVVAGVAALVLSVNPDLTATQVENILTSTADNLGPAGWDSETGWGRVNAYEALLATPPPAGVDLEAENVYFREFPGAGNIVASPTIGQQVYPHFDFTIASTSDLTGTITEIELDGGTLCTFNGTLSQGSWMTWCPTAWTATAGPHELQGRVDPNDAWDESNENNNDVRRDYNIGSGNEIFTDGFESGDTSAWSSAVE
jgi:subtilisin family serine protease